MSRVLIFFLFLCSSINGFARELSLAEEDLPKFVREENPLVQASQKEVDSFEVRKGHFARSFLPRASLLAGQEQFQYVTNGYQTQPYYAAQMELNLYNGGRDKIKDELYRVDFKKSQASDRVTMFSQLEEARKTFWRAIYLKASLQKHEEIMVLLRAHKAKALKRIRGGVATRSDRYHFEIKETEFIQDMKRMKLDLEKEKEHLKVLLGLSNEDQISLKQDLAHAHDWKRLVEHSESAHNYLIEPQKYEVRRGRLLSFLGSQKWLPKVDAYALWIQNNQRMDFDRVDEEDRRQTAFGLRATWAFSDILEGNIEKKRSYLLSQSDDLKLEFQKKELESELHLEIEELELLDSLVHEASENVERSQKLLKLVMDEYQRGVKNSEDMLSAIQTMTTSEIRKMEIIRDFHLARAHIMAKLGE